MSAPGTTRWAHALPWACRRVWGPEEGPHTVEHLVILDHRGLEVWYGTGRANFVASPDEPNTVHVHNHPGHHHPGAFSYADLAAIVNDNLLEMVAVDERWVHRAIRTVPRWRSSGVTAQLGLDLMAGRGDHRVLRNRAQVEAVVGAMGGRYERLPRRAWLSTDAGWVAPTQGPAQRLPRVLA